MTPDVVLSLPAVHVVIPDGVLSLSCQSLVAFSHSRVRWRSVTHVSILRTRPQSTHADRLFSALWGKLASAILIQNWDAALADIDRIKVCSRVCVCVRVCVRVAMCALLVYPLLTWTASRCVLARGVRLCPVWFCALFSLSVTPSFYRSNTHTHTLIPYVHAGVH